MRALCGAIITAGACIGLGLTAMGFGSRYAGRTTPIKVLSEIDSSLLFALIWLACFAVIGLGIAILGLAYHHHRRHHEFLREHGHTLGGTAATPPRSPVG
jgi:hypothetical protein